MTEQSNIALHFRNPKRCPYCGSAEQVLPGEAKRNNLSELLQTSFCKSCMRDWVDIYKLDECVYDHGTRTQADTYKPVGITDG